jgi:hypothetical protein
MKCIFLIGNYMLSCNATREVYVPSYFEQNEYCTSGRYKSCPFYCKSETVPPDPGDQTELIQTG